MKKAFFLLYFLLGYSLLVNAQSGFIKGQLADSLKQKPLDFVSIRLLNESDSTFIKGTSADEKGKFSLQTNPGKYLLNISFIGYNPIYKTVINTKEQPDSDLGILYMHEDAVALDEAVVTAKVPDMEVKGDTIVYNASAYMDDENDMLQDLVRNMPGVNIDENGNLTVNGKVINKILVDGKEFFNNDIQLALKNLPANMIKKIQLFQEQTEKSKVSGIKDSDGDQVLNLQVKEEFRKSVFGDAVIGHGNKDRYAGRGMINVMNQDNQLSFIAKANNTNESFNGIGLGLQSSMFGGGGIDTNKDFGTNFNIEKSKDFKINGNISHSDNSNLQEDVSKTENIITGNSYVNLDNNTSKRDGRNTGLNLNFSWNPDSLTTVFFRSGGSYSETKNSQFSTSSSYYIDKQDTTNNKRDYFTTGHGYNLTASLVVGRKLSPKGRNISLSINGSSRDDINNGFNKSYTTYTSGEKDKIQDQKIRSNNNSSSLGVSLSYVEPINEKNSFNISYSFSQYNGKNKNDKYKKKDESDPLGEYDVIDTLYVSSTTSKNIGQRISLGFQSLNEKYEYNISFNINPLYTKSIIRRQIDSIEVLKQNTLNYSPTLRFRYKIDNNTNFSFNYSGNSRQPSASQLSADTSYINNTSKSYGNLNLKGSFDNRFYLNFQKSDFEKGNILYVSGSINNTINQITSYSKIDSLFNSESTYKNVSGNWGFDFSIMYDTPLKKDKLTLNAYSSIYYNRNKQFANGDLNISNSTTLEQNVAFNFKSKSIQSRLQTRHSYSITRNSIQDQSNIETSRIELSNSTNIKLPYDFNLQNTISYARYFGYSSDYRNHETMWNASLSKSFLKKKKGTLKFDFYDILKNKNNTYRSVGAGYISDVRTNSITRYFMVSFSYKFNIARGGNKSNDDFLDDYYM